MCLSTVPPFLPYTCTHTPASHTGQSCPKKSGEITIQLSNSSIQRSALACSMQAYFSPQKTSNPTHTQFFFLDMLFSNHQDRNEGWLDLFFPQLLQFSLLCFVLSEHPVFLQYHSLLRQFIFLKISKSFQFLICFGFYCSFLRSSKAFHVLQKPHPLTTKDSQTFTSPEDLLTGQSSRLAAPCSGFCLLWHLSDILLGSHDSSPTAIAYLITCFHHATCAAFCSPRGKNSTWHIIEDILQNVP